MAFSWGSETPEPCKGRAKPEESVTEAEKCQSKGVELCGCIAPHCCHFVSGFHGAKTSDLVICEGFW